MKRIQSILFATLLTVALSSTAFAGNIHHVIAPDQGNIHGRAGNIHGLPAEAYDVLMALLRVMLP